ncbi:MAG TPA: hypothetical protein DDW52_14740 [Planctomycetaceae bacterium]|nr:hypothetical protein [Planctomycetaceae bacterium]
MNPSLLLTERLKLVLPSVEEARASVESLSPAEREHVSPEWLEQFLNAKESDPWIHGFAIVHREDSTEIGQCGFKGPPDEDGVVEIAYMVHPDQQGQGYATEAALALVQFAFSNDEVCIVRAHTLPEINASMRVLTKCGFQSVGMVNDPEDGTVERWETLRESL